MRCILARKGDRSLSLKEITGVASSRGDVLGHLFKERVANLIFMEGAFQNTT